jgi:uncharacterized protein
VPESDPRHRDSAPDFVPLERLRRNQPETDGALVAALRERLQGLEGQLAPEEQEALSMLLRSLDPRHSAFVELASLPPEAVLKPAEIEIYNGLLTRPAPTAYGLPRALALIVKGTRLCNLRCTYCRSWAEGPDEVMPFDVLARTIQSACASPGVEIVEFIWHGGETTLRPISFYRKALWLQQRFRRPGLRISNQLQTNATNLSQDWLAFFKRFEFGIGVSLDGPPEVHDLRRLDVKGQPTSERVREGMEKLRAHGIDFEVKMVLDDEVLALGARRILDYLLEIGVKKVALLNVVPEGDPDRKLPGDYLEFPRFVGFLRELFQLWWPTYADRISFREISDLMVRLQGGRGSFCVFEDNCMGGIYTIEPMGDIAACDRYQGDPSFTFGNVLKTEFADLLVSPNLSRAHAETDADMDIASRCRWSGICHGGCPHDRYVRVHRGVSRSEKCCGWSPLLTDMAAALEQGSSVSTRSKQEV